jgi:hypothetical protein
MGDSDYGDDRARRRRRLDRKRREKQKQDRPRGKPRRPRFENRRPRSSKWDDFIQDVEYETDYYSGLDEEENGPAADKREENE